MEFVDFDTAKLLKEKGFNIPCFYIYDKGGTFYRIEYFYSNDGPEEYSAPRIEEVQGWLRKVHQIYVLVEPYFGEDYDRFLSVGLYKLEDNYLNPINTTELSNYNNYDEALKAGISEALKSL